MNREEIIAMARECGYWSGQTIEMNDVGLERFAALVASTERNRCFARADIALLGANTTLRDRVLKAINTRKPT